MMTTPWFESGGMTFRSAAEFEHAFDDFWSGVQKGTFQPREYVLEHLSFERCASAYVDHAAAAKRSLAS